MKVTFIFVFIFAATRALPLQANDEKYQETMLKNIQAVYQAQTPEAIQNSVNAFERIANVEKDKWEPLYYIGFGYLMMCTREEQGALKDQLIDKAMEAITRAKTIRPDESELAALEGFAYMMRVTVDPGARGPQYAGLSVQSFEKSLKLNPENPRALALLAQMQFGTAKFFGSSTADACATARASIEKFGTFKSDNPLAPQWGRKMAEGLLGGCQ